jgi:hypothetical protein
MSTKLKIPQHLWQINISMGSLGASGISSAAGLFSKTTLNELTCSQQCEVETQYEFIGCKFGNRVNDISNLDFFAIIAFHA